MNCGGAVERALELVHHLALGDGDLGDLDREAQLLGHELDRDLAQADLAREGMIAAIAALGRVAEREEKALVAARQALEPDVALRRERQGLAGEVAHPALFGVGRLALDEPLAVEEVHHARQGVPRRRVEAARPAAARLPLSSSRSPSARSKSSSRWV